MYTLPMQIIGFRKWFYNKNIYIDYWMGESVSISVAKILGLKR